MKGAREMKYRVCQHCGSNLDPSERCDCQREPERRDDRQIKAAERRKEDQSNGKNDIQRRNDRKH